MKNLNIIVETPKGSRHKYDYDPETRFFKLSKLLPEGMVFPYDFGFIPGTKGEDGDPLDIILLAECGTFCGCMVECRLIGAIKGIQKEKGKEFRNDRFIGVPVISKFFNDAKKIDDVPKKIIEELELFFINYNQAAGKKYTVEEIVSPAKASDMIEQIYQQKK